MNAAGIVPEGVLAMGGERLRRQRAAEARCMKLLEGAGYEPVLLPVLEFDDGERSRGYRFVEPSGRVVAVRTDFTPLAMRVLAPTLERATGPLAVCYAGEVVRPGPVRLRQLPELYQLGFERYGADRGGLAAMELTLRLAAEVGVDTSRCHMAISVAGLAEAVLARLVDGPVGEDLVELVRARDLDAISDAVEADADTLAALEDALYEGGVGEWDERLGVGEAVAPARPLLERCAALGVPASLDVAARVVGTYYRGVIFVLWGERTQAVVAAGGEYAVPLAEGHRGAAGASLTLSLALEEAAC